ncbi:MAG: hypothetical protein KA170_00360 [Candidatus Promineofilum sp.]|nr:hypothetical protein [Promineifilum sp.]
MQTQLNSHNRSDGQRDWLAALLLRRGATTLPRFAQYYHELARQPRRWRRQLRRKLAVTVTGAALLLALAGGPLAYAEPIDTNATIQVVNGEVAITNNNRCSLMEAIWNARSTNAGNMKADCAAGNVNGSDTVVLPAGGDFVLTAAHNEVYGPTGLPVITSAVVIEGNGATIRRAGSLWDQPRFRILAVDTGGALTLRNTTISNGFADEHNGGDAHGGGILSYGALTVEGSTVKENQAYAYFADGGGISAVGTTTITNSIISDNSASGGGAASGGGIAVGGSATITGSAILDNVVGGYFGSEGGGISAGGTTTITNSLIAGNINGGSEGSFGGGGVFVGGHATITGSTIRDNLAAPYYEGYSYDVHPGMGGGLTNVGTTEIVNSTISGNAANFGGGIANLYHGALTVNASTLSGNNAYESFYIENGYVYDEEGGSGGGIFSDRHYGTDNCSTTTLKGVIVSGNTSDVSARQIHFGPSTGGSCTATITVNAFNVFGQNNNHGLLGLEKGPTDVVPSVGIAAILSPLADNGGPTQTHALPMGSPALDLVPSASCTAAPVNGVDQRGQPRNQNGKDGASANECDAGSFELGAASSGGGFLVSAAGSGTVGGVAFAPADILKYDPAAGWSMYFDGSDVGVTKNLAAFELLDNGHILMSFAANQPIDGLGLFKPQDIARFIPSATGPQTAGAFQREFTGASNWLTTSGEKIDALGWAGGRLAISTTGAAAVKLPNSTVLKAQDEDALRFDTSTGAWSAYFDGTPIPGLKAEDVNGLWIDPATGDVYVTLAGAFNLGGVAGNGRDIVKLSPSGAPGGYTPSLWWDGSAEGFPSNIDGLEIVP